MYPLERTKAASSAASIQIFLENLFQNAASSVASIQFFLVNTFQNAVSSAARAILEPFDQLTINQSPENPYDPVSSMCRHRGGRLWNTEIVSVRVPVHSRGWATNLQPSSLTKSQLTS